MHFFPLTGQPLISDLEEKKIQILKKFALLKGKQKHFKWLVQTVILKFPCEWIKHLTMKNAPRYHSLQGISAHEPSVALCDS